MATSTFGASPGVVMSWSEMWTWKAETPARVPAGARISAGKSGSVARSLPNSALALVKRSPVSCMPSPESPAKRMIDPVELDSAVADPVASASLDGVGHVACVPPWIGCRRPGVRTPELGRDRRRDQAMVIACVEVHVLDGVEQLDALGHRALERLAAR